MYNVVSIFLNIRIFFLHIIKINCHKHIMEINNTPQHKSFLWHLDFEPFTWHTFYGEQCPPFVTEENKEAWQRYLEKVIKKHLKAEVMNTPEFREIETMVNYEKLARIKWDVMRKWSMEKQRYRAKMERPRINYIPKGLSVDYEEEYSKYLMQEVSFEPRDNDDFMAQLRLLERWHKKSIPQILEKNRPDAAYAIAMTLCKHIPLLINRDDIQDLVGEYKRRIGKLIFDSYQALVEVVKIWNHEEKRQEVCRYIKETAGQYPNHRGMKKKLMDLMPETLFEGEPMAVICEPNDMEKSLL